MRSSVARWPQRFFTVLLCVALLVALSTTPAPAAGSPRLRFGVATPGGPLATAELSAVARAAGEWPSAEMWFADFGQPVPRAELDAVTSRRATPVIAWEPWRWGGGITQPGYPLDRIVAGDMDGYLRGWASGIAAWGRPVTLRFAHEMNGNWYPWAEGINGNGPGDYVAAWRHVHDLFKAAGAVNVTWMWAPNVPYPGSTPLTSLYPGRDYVDVVGLDGYNWGTAASWSSWTDPKSLFGPGLAQLRALAPGKPIVIAETASAEAGGSKPEWIKTLIAYLAAQRDIVGFVWFQFVKETDWRFDSTPASGAAFKQALANRR